MAKPLVIVESPSKAKTIAGFLGDGYLVESSIGHIRDLPRSAAEIPSAYKREAWARLGVDVDNGFKPLYVVSKEKQDQVRRLRSLVREASEVYLATDEDREGESIAWHLLEVLSPQVPVKRMVFHEITRPAIEEAIAHPRELDRRLVDAQEARRILDRLYGYELSPVLWKKVMQGLSAGRVQSVATRIVVERERERMRFRSALWWSLTAHLRTEVGDRFEANLLTAGGRRVAEGSDFSQAGLLEAEGSVLLLDQAGAESLAHALEGTPQQVTSVEERPYRRSPAPPFITSTLQQEAARKLRFSAQRTMQTAQRLYEQGHITYMRTDSTTLSQTALQAARAQAAELFGAANVAKAPRTYDRKVKNAQEAHEAIRPAGERFREPAELAREVTGDELRLYELVWQRTLASQMIDATGVTARVRVGGTTIAESVAGPAGTAVELGASGTVITSPGFLRVYREDVDEEEPRAGEMRLPALEVGEALALEGIDQEEHATKPPARYTEASLIKRLEELGVGRPSTYASIMGTIQDRGYVWRKGTALVPSFTAFAVVGLLEGHFPALVDYGFTASMEDDLDEIASGEEEATPWLSRFYFGGTAPNTERAGSAELHAQSGQAAEVRVRIGMDGRLGLKEAVSERLDTIDAREVNSIPLGADENGEIVVVRVGRYGPYLQRGDERASIPDDMAPDELTIERAAELLGAPAGDRVLGTDPTSGLPVLARAGRFGPYVQLGEAEPGGERPRTSSLFKTMSLDSLTLDEALRLLELPRVVGVDPERGEEIVARNGRYGPYLQRGSDSRSLDSEDQLLAVTLEEALARFAKPKERRFGRAAATPAVEVGSDPATGATILLREGRFGPYVTDGTVNASLRKGDDPAQLSLERAAELLADKRAAGPSTRGRAAKRGAKKTPAKKMPAKKAATKKAAAKKAPAKKAATKGSTGTKTAAKKAAAKKAAAAKKSPATRSAAQDAEPAGEAAGDPAS